MTPAGFLKKKMNLVLNKRYTKQSNRKEIFQNNIESTANKREKYKSPRNNLKLILKKSKNAGEKVKVDQNGGISFKALPYDLDLTAENKKWINLCLKRCKMKTLDLSLW